MGISTSQKRLSARSATTKKPTLPVEFNPPSAAAAKLKAHGDVRRSLNQLLQLGSKQHRLRVRALRRRCTQEGANVSEE